MATLILNVATRVAAAALSAAAARAIGGLFADDVETPRLGEVRLQSSSEGAGLPIVFGRMRLAGQIFWATQFRESSSTHSAGGKGGGPSITEYSYSVSFAVALCAGEIDGVGRVWADGALLDLSGVTMRLYKGGESQSADPLIEAVEGAGDAPAFRGTAYAVFEDLALDQFGNRIPQLTFEVFRAPKGSSEEPRLEELARGVTLIPASGEFAYATSIVRAELGPGIERAENANNSRGLADVAAAIDDLEAQLPGVQSVIVVVSWFGDDLRCGECRLRPGVETSAKITRPYSWVVNGVAREDAYVVSQLDDAPVYGGTPSDKSVLELIALLKARGYSVGLYPFILMDVPSENALPDPYGEVKQAPLPWRGRITCHPAAGETGSPDKTAAAADQTAAFFGTAAPAHFAAGSDTVSYSGPADEWSFRRMILHYARLAEMAGGVDAFLIGSEMRGLTTIRDGASSYPAVAALRTLASDVRAIVGASTKLSYAADWSEYFGHQPADGSGDVHFHLDPLWADDDIDFIGLDWYAPLADWRDGQAHADAELSASDRDIGYLQSNIENGEGFDWYYASEADRLAQIRSPITDGAAGKPWVFRYKDIRSWWLSSHYDRPAGVESATPTAWAPESKPIWFVETGFPAVDKSANQPNVFYDPKSSESAFPYFSNGARDDLIQRRALEALLSYWAPDAGLNPTSASYAGSMIDWSRIHIWTWDSRPFPDFPARGNVWRDGANWRLGHWLTGRVGISPLGRVIEEIVAAAGMETPDVSGVDGVVAGYAVSPPTTARRALEPLAQAFRFAPSERGGGLGFTSQAGRSVIALSVEDAAIGDGASRFLRLRADPADLPQAARIRFIDEMREFRAGAASARLAGGGDRPALDETAPLVFDHPTAERIARTWLIDAAVQAERIEVKAPPSALAIEPGDIISFDDGADVADYFVASTEEGAARALTLLRATDGAFAIVSGPTPGAEAPPPAQPARPVGEVLDLPLLAGQSERGGPMLAAAAAPWPGAVRIAAGETNNERARLISPAGMGVLEWDLHPGAVGRWDQGNLVRVRMHHGALSSAEPIEVFAGANLLAVEGAAGWEVVQFETAALVEPGLYEISGLLRGQRGSDPEMGAPSLAGARVVVLDGALEAVALNEHERGAALEWRFAGAGASLTGDQAFAVTVNDARIDQRPLSPVHLRMKRSAAGVAFTWIRRSRLGGDDWDAAEIPLGEDDERYLFQLYSEGEIVLSRETTAAETFLTLAEETALFEDAPLYSFEISVAQLSARYGSGAERRAVVYA